MEPEKGNAGRSTRRPLKLGAALLLLTFGLAGMYLGYRRQHPAAPSSVARTVWFYDLDSKQLSAAVAAPSGGRNVLAHVYSCGKCDEANGAGRWVGYLERDPNAGAPLRDPRNLPADAAAPMLPGGVSAPEVALPDQPDRWVAAPSPEGTALTAQARRQCDGEAGDEAGKECFPDQP